ncbi:MAG: ATP-binding protein [Deltaproteobacteria bacterium]|nr:ATP-binding protein [Deltaproteobacteria bacterium]
MARKPADGERIARIGYEAQDMRAANLVYDILVEGRLEWFRIADPAAGRVDDIQISTVDGELHAYQVKWADTIQNISFAEFIREDKNPSLISQLSQGWVTLKVQHPDKRVFVHLIHRHIPLSTPVPKAKIPINSPSPLQPHFQAFIRDCWKNKTQWLQSGMNGIPQGWRSAMEAIRQETGLFDEHNFLDFIAASNLHFGYQFPQTDEPISRQSARREKDVDQLARLIAKLGGGEKRIIQVTRTDILKELGWESRFEFHFKHEFPVDQSIYQPIIQTVHELEATLSQFTSGYLALIGTPGSGKSTTLTQTLRYRPGLRVIRYYAYVPDSIWQGSRGEAVSFLHDLYLAIQRQGVYARTGKQSQPETLEELREAISAQMGVLQEKWCEDSVRTLIVIDGLDHISREQSPERSLLKELPAPEDISEGVIIVLGSQTLLLNDFSPRIRSQLNEPGRTLTMRPLPRQAVSDIITVFPLSTSPSQEQIDKIHALANGHPLALRYLLANLRNATDEEVINTILNSTEPYHAHIEDNYRVYWEKLKQFERLKELLAMLSRLRGPFNPEEWLILIGAPAIKELLDQARHYFREESETRWHFFHNSFRQFILAQTRINILGKKDPLCDKEYHQRIAEYAAASSPETPWSWEELYHRACAEDLDKVLCLCTQSYFRKQFLGLRPLKAILEDIGICLDVARQKHDGLAIIRILLIEKELKDRQENLGVSEVDLPAILFELKSMDAAMQYVMDGPQVRIGEKEAINFAALLLKKGKLQASESVFNAAEPIEVLNGSTTVEAHHGGKLESLHAWVEIAHYFRPLNQIFLVIEQLRADTSFIQKDQNPDSFHRGIRQDVIMSLVNTIFDSGDESKLNELKALLQQRNDGEYFLHKIDFLTCSANRDSESANSALERLIQKTEKNAPKFFTNLRLAEFLYHIRNDKEAIVKWVAKISQPSLLEISSSNWNGDNLSPFSFRIRLNRILTMLGQQVKPVQAVPDDEPQRRGGVLFERCLVIIANLWGMAWAGRPMSPSMILRELDPALRLFSRPWKEVHDWTLWYAYKRTATDFYTFLIHAVAEHSQEALYALGVEFDRHWQEQPQYWQANLQRTIALELYRKGGLVEDLIKRLERIEILYSVSDAVSSLASEYSKQAFAWLEAGQPARARALFPKLFQSSFGIVYEKDYQFSNWVAILGKVTTALPGFTAEDFRRFSSALVVLENTGRCRGTRDASVDLMKLVAQWHPAYAMQLKDWLFAKHSIHYNSALDGILSAAASSPDAPIGLIFILVCHLLIPFESTVPDELPKLLAQRSALRSSASDAQVLLQLLENSLDTKAFPSHRAKWWRGVIEGLQSAAVDATYFHDKLKEDNREEKYESDLTIQLKSGEKLTQRDAMLRITTGYDLLNLIEQIDEVKYFRWDKAVAKIIDTLNYVQINSLRTALERFEPRASVNTLLATRLKSLGYINEGRALLQPLLDQSASHGWDRHLDGGSRLTAMQALIEFDPEEGREKAFNLLIKDYLTSWRSPGSFLANLEDFLPLLFVEPPLADIWREIREHVYQLHEFSDIESLPPTVGENCLSWQSVMMQLIADSMQIEIAEVRDEAYRALCKVCLNPAYDSDSCMLLSSMLNGTETQIFHALAVFESILDQRSQFIGEFSRNISRLSISENLVIRKMAVSLVQALNIPCGLLDYKPLGLTYSLELPDFPTKDETMPFSALLPGASFPDCNDPLEMIRPFQDDFELLSEASGIPMQNLVCRAAMLMKTLSPEEQWSKKAEEDMKSWLKSADLELTYHRLRPQQALRALHHVAAELIDSKKLNGQAQSYFEHSMKRHDRMMSCKDPSQRPVDINLTGSNEIGLHRDKDWIDKGADVLTLMPERLHKDSSVVLAELTRIRHLDWDSPTEYRFSMLCHPDWPLPDKLTDSYHFFCNKYQWRAEDYPDLDMDIIPAVVIDGHPRGVEFGGNEWLAINPKIALHLGWKCSTGGLFRWEDSDGRTVVESLWWQDGPIDRQPPRSETCSEGWLVVATESAYREIQKFAVPLIRLKAVTRTYRGRETNDVVRSLVCRCSL